MGSLGTTPPPEAGNQALMAGARLQTGGHRKDSSETISRISPGAATRLQPAQEGRAAAAAASTSGQQRPPLEDGGDASQRAKPTRGGGGGSRNNSKDEAEGQWLVQVASQTQQRVSQASGQLGHSLRQFCASASSLTAAAAANAADVLPPSYHNIPGIVPYYQGRSIGPPPSYDDVINPYAPPPTYQSLFGQMREARKSSRGLLDLLRRLLVILLSTLGCSLLLAFMILIPFTMILIGALYLDECKIEHIPAFLLAGGSIWAAKNLLHCYAQCRKMELQERSEALAAGLYLAAGATASQSAATDGSLSNVSLASSERDATADEPGRREAAHDADQESAVAAAGGLERLAALQAASCNHANPTSGHGGNQRPAGELAEQRASRFKSSVCESLLNCILVGWFIAGCVIVLRNYEPDFADRTSARYCHKTVYMYTFWLVSSTLAALLLFLGCVCCLMFSSALANRHADLDLA